MACSRGRRRRNWRSSIVSRRRQHFPIKKLMGTKNTQREKEFNHSEESIHFKKNRKEEDKHAEEILNLKNGQTHCPNMFEKLRTKYNGDHRKLYLSWKASTWDWKIIILNVFCNQKVIVDDSLSHYFIWRYYRALRDTCEYGEIKYHNIWC